MSDPRTVITDALDIINADPALDAVGRLTVLGLHGLDGSNPRVIELCSLIVASRTPDPTTILQRARNIAARVADLNVLDRAHPGLASQEQVREEREWLIAEIGRLMLAPTQPTEDSNG